jgi:hypothetical protein
MLSDEKVTGKRERSSSMKINDDGCNLSRR